MAVTETELKRPAMAGKNGAGAPTLDRPDVSFHESARALLTPEVREVLDGVLVVVHERAQREGVALEGVEVYATTTCDEIEGHLIVSAQTGLPAAPAFALWDALSDAVQEWASTLPKAQEDIAIDLIALEVGWDVNSAAL